MSNEEQTPNEVEENPQAQPEMAAEQSESAEETSEASMDDELNQLTDELSEAKNQLLRAQADVQNIRRRAEQDVEKAHKFGQEKLVNDLLPIIDNLERALESMSVEAEALKPLIEGVELTLKSFQDTLQRHNIVAVHPLGEPFDPQLHQAMAMVESPDAEPNTVINVFQKGYTLHGRLVRPAMVVVAKDSA